MRVSGILLGCMMWGSLAWGVQDTDIVRLIVPKVGKSGSDYIVFANAPNEAIDLIKAKTLHLFCIRLSKKTNDWQFFSPCGKISPIFGDTYKIDNFPALGKIEEVLSGRIHRYRDAMTIAVSTISAAEIPKGTPSSTRLFVKKRIEEYTNEKFIALELLRHGSL